MTISSIILSVKYSSRKSTQVDLLFIQRLQPSISLKGNSWRLIASPFSVFFPVSYWITLSVSNSACSVSTSSCTKFMPLSMNYFICSIAIWIFTILRLTTSPLSNTTTITNTNTPSRSSSTSTNTRRYSSTNVEM